VSYGGSSLLASFVVVGLLLSISHRSAVAETAASEPRPSEPEPAAGEARGR
jgi:hypothetical protein